MCEKVVKTVNTVQQMQVGVLKTLVFVSRCLETQFEEGTPASQCRSWTSESRSLGLSLETPESRS